MQPLTLNCRGTLLSLEEPRIMGILNLTPDSFSDGGRYITVDAALQQAEALLTQGAHLIDIGGYSSRPGAEDISEEEELRRVLPATEAIRKAFPQAILSADTFRPAVAAAMLDRGVHILNDITAGRGGNQMAALAAAASAPLVLMHMQGMPQTMQAAPQYVEVATEVSTFLTQQVQAARSAGVKDIIADPGFGFGKTLEHNYALLAKLTIFSTLGAPLLVGVSRKRMITAVVGQEPAEIEAATHAIHLRALMQGARILRVHEPAPTRKTIEVFLSL